jgi:hypothetical protein
MHAAKGCLEAAKGCRKTASRNECTPTDTHMYTINTHTHIHTNTHTHTHTHTHTNTYTYTYKYRRHLSAIGRVHTNLERNLDELIYSVDHKVSQPHILEEPLSM